MRAAGRRWSFIGARLLSCPHEHTPSNQAASRRSQAGRVPVRSLHGQVLPLFRPADRDADDARRTSTTSAGTCCTIGRAVFIEDGDWYLLVHTDLQASAGRQPLRHLRHAAADLPRLLDRRTASTRTTGSTTSTSKRPSRSRNTPRRCCRRKARTSAARGRQLLPVTVVTMIAADERSSGGSSTARKLHSSFHRIDPPD